MSECFLSFFLRQSRYSFHAAENYDRLTQRGQRINQKLVADADTDTESPQPQAEELEHVLTAVCMLHIHAHAHIQLDTVYTSVHDSTCSLTWRQHAKDRAGVASALGTRLWLVGWLAGVGGLGKIHDT